MNDRTPTTASLTGTFATTSAYAADSSMGRIMLELGMIDPEEGERILRLQKEKNLRFGEAACSLGLVTQAEIEQVLARQFAYPYLKPGEGNFAPELVAAYQPFNFQVEALRALRSQLMLRWFATGRRAITLVGVDTQTGTSLLAANLAVVFSQLGEQTLLVDANLRRPRQHAIFNLSGRQGLSDVLVGRAAASGDDGAIAKIDAFVDLSVLQAGTLPPNPVELLGRAPFAAFNTQLGARFDVVIYDTPALAVGADAVTLAATVGGAVLVARKDVTRMADISRAAAQLASLGVEVVGAVLVDGQSRVSA